MDMASKLSVVIATRNEEKNIENCIKSVVDQIFPREKVEIIVVDNGSKDNTVNLAKKYTENVYDLARDVNLSNIKNFRGAQVNFGVGKSIGDIIFFPDADMTFDENLFSDVIDKFKKVDALYVPEIICGKGFFGKIRNFERSFYNQTCIDGVRFVGREAFLKVGGFDVKNIVFGPDDWDFTKTLKKNNFGLGITEKSLFHHEEWLDWKTYINKKTKYIATFDSYIAKWGKSDPDIKKQFGLSYRFFGVFIENGKWKKLLSHPVLTVGMYGLRFLVGVKFLLRKNEKHN